ncbi:MAG: UvrD-helicase domain-containing protein [Actinomycetota bacterium]|nr:UvrD-helicase domain-containing protein [Actinomycetota bacterium]
MTLAAGKFTEEQLAAIEARGGSVIVSANAGSGKTSVLVERFVQSVLDEGTAVDAILAITFSEKAADQLRQRIRGRLAELGADAAARNAADANISTIHGFCASMLRAHSLSAGLDPGFVILDDVRAQRLAGEACDGAFEDALDAHGEAGLDVTAAYEASALRRVISDLHGRLRSRGEALPALPDPPPQRNLGPLRTELAQAARAGAVALGAGRLDLTRVREGLSALERCGALLDGGEEELALGDLASVILGNGTTAELQGEECARYRAAFEAYRQACVERRAEPVYGVVATLLRAFTRRYAELKRGGGWVDFDDLELGVVELLRSRPGVAEGYARRFELVMVDEFQDVNARQLEIVDAIARDNLFLVGDEFQSIYGFRHAELELFRTRRTALQRLGAARSLQTSFRAHEQLLDTLNAAVSARLGEGFLALRAGRALQPDGEPPFVEVLVTEQRAWGDSAEDGAPVTDLGEPAPGTTRWRLAEARLLGQHVRHLVDSTRYRYHDIVVLLRATGDMAVFERALEDQGVPTYLVGGRGYWGHPQVRDLMAWLGVLANPDDTLAFYEVLASPLVGCSSSAMVMLAATAERLGRTPWWALREAVARADEQSDHLLAQLELADRDALASLARRVMAERSSAFHRPIEELIERAVAHTGYDLRVLAMPGGQRRMANVRKLLRLAREHEAQEGRDLRGFLRLVDRLAEDRWGGPVEGEAPVQSESDGPVDASALDAVRIMTIHRAKGLEFPVVCVADLGRTPPPAADVVVLSDDGRLGVRLRTVEGETGDAYHYRALVDERRARDFEEEQRLFYVAMTRAEERLVLSGSIRRLDQWPEPKPGCSPLSWIAPALVPDIQARLSTESPVIVDHDRLSWEGRPAPVRCLLNVPETIGTVLAAESLAPVPAPELKAGASDLPPAPELPPPPPRDALVPRLSYSALEDYAHCGYRFYLQRVAGMPERALSLPVGDGAPGATARLRGTVVHELLEHLDFVAPVPPSPAEVRAVAASHDGAFDEETAREVVALLERFADSALCARLAGAVEVRREAPFAFSLDVGAARPVLVTGVVDAMTTGGSEALVVDYKSDRVIGMSLDELVQRAYVTQRLIYALAALRAGAERVEVVHCFLERADEPVAAHYARDDVAGLERALIALASGLVGERFEVTPRPNRELCSGCPGRGSLCTWELAATLGDAPTP